MALEGIIPLVFLLIAICVILVSVERHGAAERMNSIRRGASGLLGTTKNLLGRARTLPKIDAGALARHSESQQPVLVSSALDRLSSASTPYEHRGARRQARIATLRSLPLVLMTLFALVPSVASTIFATFSCDGFGTSDLHGNEGREGRVHFLQVDLSVPCYHSLTYATLVRHAKILIFIWPVGVPLLFGFLLFICRNSIVQGKEDDELARAISFIYVEYKPEYYWWDLVELAKKVRGRAG